MRPDWSHGFLIPLFSLYLVHAKRAELMRPEHTGSLWGAVVMLLSVFVYVGSIVYRIGYPQPLTIITMIAGLVLLVRGWRTLWVTLFPVGFLLLAIPPPERLLPGRDPAPAAGCGRYLHPGVEHISRRGRRASGD